MEAGGSRTRRAKGGRTTRPHGKRCHKGILGEDTLLVLNSSWLNKGSSLSLVTTIILYYSLYIPYDNVFRSNETLMFATVALLLDLSRVLQRKVQQCPQDTRLIVAQKKDGRRLIETM